MGPYRNQCCSFHRTKGHDTEDFLLNKDMILKIVSNSREIEGLIQRYLKKYIQKGLSINFDSFQEGSSINFGWLPKRDRAQIQNLPRETEHNCWYFP